ncbi:MAG: SIMPL domain-containing protein, partial [Treponema sp.]|nr:SIMPL domain-containing protein [Treponema sp.]
MKKSALVFAVLSMLAFLSCSQKDVNKMRSIAVSGTGKVIVTPDKATVKLAVITRKSDIKEAQEENAKAMKKIQDALLAKGVTAENLQTYDYEISQDSHWKNDERVYG